MKKNSIDWSKIRRFRQIKTPPPLTFLDYCHKVHRGHWQPSKVHLLICDALQHITEGKNGRLMIWMPPRHGKSMTVTETFPSYYLGRFPDRRVIEISYGDSLAQRFGRLNRQKFEEYGQEVFGRKIAGKQSSSTNWGIEGHQGGMLSVGIGGGITGQGADLMIIDDPVKNALESESITYRERVWSEWQSTLRTRLHAGATVIVILTRWHEDDLAGRLINPEYGEVDNWKILSLPAICEQAGDLLNRQIGDPLWPEGGYDEVWAEKTKRSVGSRTWTSLYQQRPAPSEGSLLKKHWWQYYTELPKKFDQVTQSWDCAFKGENDSDYVVGGVWGRIGANKYLIDQIRRKMSFTETIEAIKSMKFRHPKTGAILIEDKANGTAVIDLLKKTIPGLIPVEPQGGKIVRAQAASPDIEAGNVYLPHWSICPWTNDFVDECTSFPKGAHDDQVDQTTQYLNWARENSTDWTAIEKIYNEVKGQQWQE